MKIAFLGLGAMGGAMARTRIRKGHQLADFDPAAAALAAFRDVPTRIVPAQPTRRAKPNF